MHTYVKLKDGRIMIIWSDNTDEETMSLYPLSQKDDFDAEWDTLYTYPYSDIEKTDSNLSVINQ